MYGVTMSEMAPAVAVTAAAAALIPVSKAPAKKPKKAAEGSKAWKAVGPSVTELITKVVAASKESKGVSLAALKKALAAGGYNVEKNSSCIKLGLKSLVNEGTLVHTKGIGALGSFKLSKKSGETKEKAPKKPVAKPKKPAAKKPTSAAKKPKKAAVAKKSPKKAKKPAAVAKKMAKSPKKVKAAKPKKAAKSPAKAKAVKPKAVKVKPTKPKTVKAKRAAPKKK